MAQRLAKKRRGEKLSGEAYRLAKWLISCNKPANNEISGVAAAKWLIWQSGINGVAHQ